MIALARELLDDPNWLLHAAQRLGQYYAHRLWPIEAGWWLNKCARMVAKLNLR